MESTVNIYLKIKGIVCFPLRFKSCWFFAAVDRKTVVFFANARDGQCSKERSGASVKTARENGERRYAAVSARSIICLPLTRDIFSTSN